MTKVNLSDYIVIDIETASEYPSFENMDENLQQLWIEKSGRQLTEETNAAAFYQMRSGVMAEFAKIVCISIGCFIREESLKLKIKSFYGNDEKLLLNNFIHTMNNIKRNKWSFAGHNIKEFDIPFICRRMLINEIVIPDYLDFQNTKPWENNMFDTFQYWRFGDYKNFTSLKLLSKILNVPSSKDDIDGSMVGGLYWEADPTQQEINLMRIAEYCNKDVATTANIMLRMTNEILVNEANISFVKSN